MSGFRFKKKLRSGENELSEVYASNSSSNIPLTVSRK